MANNKGLGFPKCDPGLFPNFICEACQVRAQTDRELVRGSPDIALLMLERQRQLDTMHKWAQGTLGNYSGMFRRLDSFQQFFQVKALKPTPLLGPPTTPAIPTMWAQLLYSVQPGKTAGSTITYNTSRALRSASSLYYSWDLQVAYPGQAVKALDNKHLVLPHIIPSDELGYTLQNGGMARRMGTQVQPSWALQFKHVKFINDRLERDWQAAADPAAKHELAAAGAANAALYTTWCRGGEQFDVLRCNVNNYGGETGPQFGLPLGTGHVTMKMRPETKSDPTLQADVVVARTCASGISLGLWMDRLLDEPSYSPTGHLFSTPNKPTWNSRHFLETYAWRILEDMRHTGEPTLKAFTNEPGFRIRDRIYSCHSWRRCGETTVSKFRRGINFRKATEAEEYEHARWTKKNQPGKERIHLHYRQWPLDDRLGITLFCL